MQVNKGSNGRKRTIGTSVCCAALSVSLVAGLSPLPSFAAHTADAATSAQSSTNAAKVTIPSTVLDLQKKVNELWISEDGKDVPMQFNGASRATTWVTPAIMNQAQHLLVQAYTELFTSSTHQLSSSTTSQIESFYKKIKNFSGGIGADINNTPESETINFVLHSYDDASAIKTVAKSLALSFVNTANKRQRFTTIKTDPKNRQLECLVVLPKKPAS